MNFEGMNPIFLRVVAECTAPLPQITAPAPFLVQVCDAGSDQLRVIASDFQHNTFQAIKTRQQLEDLRDDIGIGGSWSDFVDYITTSLRSGDVKLVTEGMSGSTGAAYAKLIAQKAKGLPKISLHLVKVVSAAAAEANANLALELHKEFIDAQGALVKEQQSRYELTKIVAAEQEKSLTLRKQLDMFISSRKGHSMKMSNTENLDSSSALISQDSPDKHAAHSPSSKRGANRVAPAHRRSKVRGAVLHDTADDA